MKKVLFISLVLLSCLVGCVSPQMSVKNEIKIQGSLVNGKYAPPSKAFSCQVPSLITPGARISDHVSEDLKSGDVSFQDDLGTWVNIIYFPKPKGMPSAGAKRRALFDKFSVRPGVRVLKSEWIDAPSGESLFVVLDCPKGSNMADASTGERKDMVEGVFIFSEGGLVLRVSAQYFSLWAGDTTTLKQKSTKLKKTLLAFKDAMKFPAPYEVL